MKTGVQNIIIKLIDPEVKESLSEIIEDPEAFHGTEIEDENEIEISGRAFEIIEREGNGSIGPWTQIILKVDANETPIDMVILMDTSYSMITDFDDTTRFDLAVNGIIELIGVKSKKLITGVMAYGVDWEMSLDMTNARSFTKKKLSDLRKELSETKHKGKAAVGTALGGASEVFSIKGLNDLKAVVILSDGADEIGPNPLKEADKLSSRGIYIYPFYLGEEKDQKSLTIFERIAAKSHSNLFSLYDAAAQEKRRLIRASLKSAAHEEEKANGETEPVDADQDNGDEGNSEGDADSIPEPDDSDEGISDNENDENARTLETDIEGPEKLEIPSGSELFLRQLRELGSGLSFTIQERGGGFLSDDDSDVQVIKAGILVKDVEEPENNDPTFNRTPKIFDAIKNFIEWVKGLIW